VHTTPETALGSFIRIPESLHEEAWAEAQEVFIEEKAKWILRFQQEWNRKRHLEEVDDEFRKLVETRMKELESNCL